MSQIEDQRTQPSGCLQLYLVLMAIAAVLLLIVYLVARPVLEDHIPGFFGWHLLLITFAGVGNLPFAAATWRGRRWGAVGTVVIGVVLALISLFTGSVGGGVVLLAAVGLLAYLLRHRWPEMT